MPVVEVACPGCGAKLKAPNTMAGKKAKCKKCGKTFRIPGVPVGDSASEPQALSVLAMPVPPLPDDDPTEVMMAEAVDAVEVTLPLPSTAPNLAKNLASLPSADPFDFGKPAPAAPPAKPAFRAAKAAPPPAKPQVGAAPKPAPPPPKPQAASAPKPAPPPAAKPQVAVPPAKPQAAAPAKPEPAPLSLDDDDFQPIEPPPAKKPAAKEAPSKAKAAPLPKPEPEPLPAEESNPFADNPFAFSGTPEKSEKPAKSKRRDEDDEKPAKSKHRDEDDEDQKTRKERKDDEEEPKPKKKEKPASKAEPEESGGFNPFANFDTGPAEEPAPKDEKPAKSKRRDEDDEDDKKLKKKRKGEDESEEPDTPRYRRPQEQGGMGKMILITGVIGLFALGLGIVAVVMYIKNNKKEPEQQAKKDEKKDEVPPPMPPVQPAPPEPKPKDKNSDLKSKDSDPKPKDPDPKPKDPDPVPASAPTRPRLDLGKKLRAFTVGPLPPMTEGADRPQPVGAVLETPLASVKRVFPPFDPKSGDTCVLIQTNAGLNGKGEKLALDSYGPAKNLVTTARIEYDGDGSPVPIADLSASQAGVYFLAVTGGKLHVWSVVDKKKIADGVDPYAEKPEHAKAGLAAAFFSAADLNQVVTVSTAGAVLLYDLRTNKAVSEYIPPNGAPGKVSLGLSVAKADGNGSVAVAVAGVLYQVKAVPGLEVLREYDLGGDVGRSLGLAVSGTPGRLLYVFETVPDKTGKKDRAVLGLPLGDKAKHILYAFPASAGEPKGALWANDTGGGVVTDRGVLWFDDEEGKFLPMFLTQSPSGGQYFGDERYFWYVVPHSKEPGKSMLVALSVPFNDFGEYLKSFAKNQPLRAVKIDGTGLSK